MMTNGNGLVFNGEGPVMSGTWYNPNNGDSFTVRDTYFENNQLVVLTTDGRLLDYNFILNYIKSDKPITKNTNNINNFEEELPDEVKNLVEGSDSNILQEDLDLINGNKNMIGLGNLNTPQNQSIILGTKPENVNYAIIEKALSEKSKPIIKSTFEWNDIPEKEMHLLIDVLGITIDELIEWYSKSINTEDILKQVRASLKDYIYNIIESTPAPAIKDKPIIEKSKEKKSKTTKK